MRLSLFKKIFISQLALIVLASGVISLAGYFFLVRLYSDSQNETLRVVSSSTALRVATDIARHRNTLKEIAQAGEVALYAENDQAPLLAEHLGRYQAQFPILGYADQEGNQKFCLVKGQADEALGNPVDQKVIQASLAAPNQAIVGDVVLDPLLQTQTLRFAYTRTDDSGGQFLGLIFGQTPLARIISPEGGSASPQNSYCLVVTPDGKILGGPEPKGSMTQLVAQQDLALLFANAAAEPGGRIHQATVNGEPCRVAVARIAGTPWLAMSVLPSRHSTAMSSLLQNFSLLLFLALLLLASLSSRFLARGITAPLQKLGQATAAMAKGDFAQRLAGDNDEIGDLAGSFNTMAETLGTATGREKQLLAAETSARMNAELADQHKSALLAKISHELRTPLNTVLGMAELLENGQRSGRPQPEITAIKEAGRNLLQLVDGIIDFSRLENGTMCLAPAPFDLYALLDRLIKKYQPAAKAKGLTLFSGEPEAVPTTVVGDEGRIGQILENLLDNAIKFTEYGEVSLRVRPLGLKAINDEHIIHLRFEVADTGWGIPREQQAAMLESFKQIDSLVARKTGGLGIGLTIAQQLIEIMQGKITMKSEPGKGSIFSVDLDLPVAKQEATPALTPRASGFTTEATDQHSMRKAMNILVAEDNPVNQKLLRLMLEMHGQHTVRMTADGKEAIAVYQSETIDLILMDVQMPGMNGFEATATIRELEKNTGAHIPIIAVTAHAMPGYKEECLNAGMDSYLAKPFRMQELFEIIEKTLAQLNKTE